MTYDLDEALTLLAALEDARDALIESGHLAAVVAVEAEIRLLNRRLGFGDPSEVLMTDNTLRVTEAARRLGMSTKELLKLIRDRKIDYVMQDGIAHVPEGAIDEYRTTAS